MAKNKTEQTNNAIDNLNDTLTGFGAKVQQNQKIIFMIVGILAVVVLGVIVYIYAFREPGIQAADEAVSVADTQLALGNDSIALEEYKKVVDKYGYDAGNRAALQAAILLYDKQEYQEAIDYLKKFTTDSKVAGPAAYALEGNCYVNLGKYDEAVSSFKKAISESDDNPAYTPFFMQKLATVYRGQGNYKAEAEVYGEILKKYPAYGSSQGIDIEKYLDRAKIQAGQ